MKRITVLLADDNKLVRTGFRKILEVEDDLEVVGEAKNGLQAVSMVKKLRPALVLMDITMPLLNGLQATCQILEAVPATKVLILSAHSDDAYVEAATDSGAMGYLLKQTCANSVCSAIREVEEGNTSFSPSIPRRLHKRNRKRQIE
jgi:DNA-binding NarL/FixJ family response regulator